MNLIGQEFVFQYFGREKILRLLSVSLLQIFQILSSMKFLEIWKRARMRRLVNKCKNTDTKIKAFESIFYSEN